MKRETGTIFTMLLAACLWLGTAFCGESGPEGAFPTLPIDEITVFKDGHTFVLHEGEMPVDETGTVILDTLPRPVIGTFWPFSADPGRKLRSVKSSKRIVEVDRTALGLFSLLRANIGAELIVEENEGEPYSAFIESIPERSSKELRANSPRDAPDALPEVGRIVLFKTDNGTRVVPVESIRKVTFKKPPRSAVRDRLFRDLLYLNLDKGSETDRTARVGMVYLQKGIRWVPSYRIVLDGKGRATIKLQATLLNEMIDLEDVTANLVIGVPSFAFKETIDPISLQEAAAQLSHYFREDSRTAYAFSNAIMTQGARMNEYRRPSQGGSGGEELTGSGKDEDLFIFTVEHVSLKRGERLVVPLVEFELDYNDVYTLDLPIKPPNDFRRHFSNQQQQELASLFNAPKVKHKIRLVNDSEWPLTTAPALLLHGRQILGQGMMTYTTINGSVDVTITTAVDIRVHAEAHESKRTDKDLKWDGYHYSRIDLEGTISLANGLDKPVELEVIQRSAGRIDSADSDGVIVHHDLFNIDDYFAAGSYPHWWHWYSWPWWWPRLNGYGKVTWNVTLEPGEKKELKSGWHYFWR